MTKKCIFVAALALALTSMATTADARTLQPELQQALESIAAQGNGRVGACAQDRSRVICVNGDGRFSLQSVMKLVVAMAVMDRVDRQGWRLDTPVTVRREDLSLYVQPIAKLVTPEGYRTTIADLVHRAVVDSDSAATDILIERLGGPKAVQAFLKRKRIGGIRIDRDERHLQTEIAGLTWKPEYVDADLLDRAMEAVPPAEQDAAFARYRADVRDTATPKGMTALLHSLATGRLLSPASTRHLLGVMEQTVTFPDRLKAGVPEGWTLGHKTGSSGSHKGLTVATNDVGIITAPDGGTIAVTAFVADSTAPSAKRNAVIAEIARTAVAHYR